MLSQAFFLAAAEDGADAGKAIAIRSRNASTAPISFTPSAYRSRASASTDSPSISSAIPQPSPISRWTRNPSLSRAYASSYSPSLQSTLPSMALE